MIITIDKNTGQIKITSNFKLNEKDEKIKTVPIINHPIQYNLIDIKRKYYKKWDPQYHRKQGKVKIKKSLNSLVSGKTVIQEPLLDQHY